jgi:hypothetical protein
MTGRLMTSSRFKAIAKAIADQLQAKLLTEQKNATRNAHK